MKILITGSTGVIGKHLIKILKREYPSSEIIGTFYQTKLGNLNDLSNCDNRHIKYFQYKEIFKFDYKFDQIWHLATYGQPAKFIENWDEVIKLNTSDILYLSKLLKPNGKFLYASTSELYGPQF